MGELLSSLDVVNKAFKKSLRGYDPAEVDEFLDRVAESIQAYVQQTKEFERVMEDQAEKLSDYERVKSSLHEALLMAQRTAEEKVANASRTADEKITAAKTAADDIIADAKVQAERLMQDAEASVARHGEELRKLQQIRDHAFEKIRAFAGDIKGVVEGAENGLGIQIPDFTQDVMKRGEVRKRSSENSSGYYQQGSPGIAEAGFPGDSPAPGSEAEKRQEISETLNVLGIDPNLLDTDSGQV